MNLVANKFQEKSIYKLVLGDFLLFLEKINLHNKDKRNKKNRYNILITILVSNK